MQKQNLSPQPSPSLEIGAAYIRVSTDDQTELSPDAQLREIQARAKADGYLIPPEYIFIERRGISGRRSCNRPEFQRMIAIAKSQKPSPFRRLYLWKFSRFARNQDESTFYKGILRKKCQVEIISVSEPIMEGMFGRLIETIIEWNDEYYSINLSGEVIRGMTEKAIRNGYQTSPCLGYAAAGEGKPFVLVEKEYKIVEYIHQSYHSGADMTSIARSLNQMGYRTKRGNPFDRRAVSLILSNPFYKGTVSWKDISFQGSHETRPSVTDIFDDNQARIRSEYRPARRREASSCLHWASGLLECSICGASLSYNHTKDSKRHPPFFQCWKYSKGLHPGSCSITVRRLEESILNSIDETLRSGELHYEYQSSSQKKEEQESEFLRSALARLEVKERRIREAYINEIDTLEDYRQNKELLRQEREHLEEQAARLQARQPAQASPQNKARLLEQLQQAYDLLKNPEIDYEQKGRALRKVVKRIVYDRSQDSLTFHYYIMQ